MTSVVNCDAASALLLYHVRVYAFTSSCCTQLSLVFLQCCNNIINAIKA